MSFPSSRVATRYFSSVSPALPLYSSKILNNSLLPAAAARDAEADAPKTYIKTYIRIEVRPVLSSPAHALLTISFPTLACLLPISALSLPHPDPPSPGRHHHTAAPFFPAFVPLDAPRLHAQRPSSAPIAAASLNPFKINYAVSALHVDPLEQSGRSEDEDDAYFTGVDESPSDDIHLALLSRTETLSSSEMHTSAADEGVRVEGKKVFGAHVRLLPLTIFVIILKLLDPGVVAAATLLHTNNARQLAREIALEIKIKNANDHAMTTLPHAQHSIHCQAYASHYIVSNLLKLQPEVGEVKGEVPGKMIDLGLDILVASSTNSLKLLRLPQTSTLVRFRLLCDSDKITAEFVCARFHEMRAKTITDKEPLPLMLPTIVAPRQTYKENVGDIFALNCTLSCPDTHGLPLSLIYQETRFAFFLKKNDLDGELLKGFINPTSKKGKYTFSSMDLQKMNARMKYALHGTLILSEQFVSLKRIQDLDYSDNEVETVACLAQRDLKEDISYT
ncbi:hypothetical protein R3P38DRAFT_3177170 [Favolaschia claudopus]|uniref:Uncharacterized protein n=1 Tax=Favolaschia claudopus TaxID=2862362 RepID=A0AAW0D1Y1_9AGAR